MKFNKNPFLILLLLITLLSCESQVSKSNNYCGYELTRMEYNILCQKADKQRKELYDADSLWSIYDQVNDTLRQIMPDTVTFEVFLNTLDKKHFSFIVIAPKNNKYFETIACKFMKAKFKGDIPKKRILCLHSYTNPDGSGESPIEIAIKNNND